MLLLLWLGGVQNINYTDDGDDDDDDDKPLPL